MRTVKLILSSLLAAATLALLSLPVAVEGQGSVGPTATPDAEGVIYAVVEEGDSFWTIAARHDLTLEEIYELNDAEEGDFVQVGQKLIVGYGDQTTPADEAPTGEAATPGEEGEGETEATPEPTVAATPSPPPSTPTPTARGGEICLSAYLDENQNGQQDAGEPLKSSVAFTISNGEAVVSNYVTDGVSEPYCITGLDDDNYRVTRSQANGEVLTTPGEWSVSLAEESSQTVAFGSYLDPEAGTALEEEEEAAGAPDDSAADPLPEEEGITRIIVIAAVVVSVLLLVGVLVIVLSVRRATV